MSDNLCILILGVGRDGTSLLTNLVSQLGFFVGHNEDLIPANEINPYGFWEVRQVIDLNTKIMRENNVPEYTFIGRIKSVSSELYQEIDSFYKDYYSPYDKVVIKDPRFAITLPVWSLVIQRYHDIKIIHTTREVKSHINSLIKTSANSIIRTYIRERRAKITKYLSHYPSITLEYDKLIQSKDLISLSNFLDIDYGQIKEIAKAVIRENSHDL